MPQGYKSDGTKMIPPVGAHKGFKHSIKSKEKMSEKLKGRLAWNKGKPAPWAKGNKHRVGKSSWNKGLKGYMAGEKNVSKRLDVRNKISERKSGVPHLNQRGENSGKWKGGITPLLLQIRNCFEYRVWRSDVFTRDDYICQLCGLRGVEIHADHYPKKFSTIFYENKITSLEQALACEEFWNINNGRTLCKPCHLEETKKNRN